MNIGRKGKSGGDENEGHIVDDNNRKFIISNDADKNSRLKQKLLTEKE